MKTAIVGLGARISHVAVKLREQLPEADFTSYCDPNPAGLAMLQKHTGCVPAAYDTLVEMLAAEKPDLLMVGSPNFMHLDHLRTALQSDVRFIFTEKPVVISAAETFDLLELLRRHGGTERVMIGLVLRYAPLYVALRDAQAKGLLGNIVSIEASEHIAPYHGSFFMRDWRRYAKNSGGFMLEKCCHDIDLYQGLVGSRPAHIASFGGRKSYIPENRPEPGETVNQVPEHIRERIGDRTDPFTPRWGGANASEYDSDGDIVDYQTAIVEYENGASMAFHTNTNVPDEFRRFAVMGTRGMAEGDFIRDFFRVTDSRTHRRLIDLKSVANDTSGHYGADSAICRDITAHMKQGVPLPVSLLDALEAGLTALAMDEARVSRKVVDMSEKWQEFDSYGLR